MRYNEELRRRVTSYVQQGGSKTEAARRFGLCRPTIYQWLAADDKLASGKPRPGKSARLDLEDLRKAVEQNPYRPNRLWAKEFGVSEKTIQSARRRMKLKRERGPGTHAAWKPRECEIHEVFCAPPAFVDDHEELQRLVSARADEEAEHLI
jgi:Transposase